MGVEGQGVPDEAASPCGFGCCSIVTSSAAEARLRTSTYTIPCSNISSRLCRAFHPMLDAR
jgi:hypothetical protein